MTREEAIVLLECSATEAVGTLAATTEPSAAKQLQRYIDAYDVAIAALREQGNCCKKGNSSWISVEDRLPERKGQYMVRETWSYGNMISLAYYTPKYDGFEEHLKGRAIWYNYDSEYGDFEVHGVTHWMPLPEPPEVEG